MSRFRDYDGSRDQPNNYHRSDRGPRDYYGEDRIRKRHRIMEEGVPSVWGQSPSRDDDRLIKEELSNRKSSRDDRHARKSEHRSHESKRKSSSHHNHKSGHRKSKKRKKDHHRHRHRSSSSSCSSSSSVSYSNSPVHDSNINVERTKMIKNDDDICEVEVIKGPMMPPKIKEDKDKKPASYVEVMNKREEEEFISLLEKKQEDSKKEVELLDSNGVSGSSNQLNPKEFGKALLPGEGAAMAAYVTSGKRIPRRGEIGLTSDEIEKFEKQGYVMSGSRHRRMEAVRVRKENQIYSADEKRLLLTLNKEEKARKTEKTLSYLGQIIEKKH